MSDERDGLETLSKAIDTVAGRLPAASPRRKPPARSLLAAAACLVAVMAGAAYLWLRPAVLPAPVGPSASAGGPDSRVSLGVEVKLLRVRGSDVDARVFDAGRAGAVIVAPAGGGTR